MQKLLGYLRRAVNDFSLIADGDKIAVGLSGGKDSLTLLYALSLFRRFFGVDYTLAAIAVDMGFGDNDVNSRSAFADIAAFCDRLEVPLYIEPIRDKAAVSSVGKETPQFVNRHSSLVNPSKGSPCSLCAKLRRGVLNSTAAKMGFNKVALGHHADDFLETFFLSLIFEGRLSVFKPLTYLDKTNVTVIRPLVYAPEYELSTAAKKCALPVMKNPCPYDKHTMRERVKTLVADLSKSFPGCKEQFLGALFNPERNNLL